MVSVQIANTHVIMPNNEYWWVMALLLLMSSIVIADSKLRLDFPDEFYSQSIDTELERGSQAKNTDGEQKWRKSASPPPIDVRWKSKSVYEENRHLAPLVPGVRHSSQTRQALDINPQLELRF